MMYTNQQTLEVAKYSAPVPATNVPVGISPCRISGMYVLGSDILCAYSGHSCELHLCRGGVLTRLPTPADSL